MSHDGAETIRRAYEVWNESGPAAVTTRFWAEDAVYREGPGWPDGGVFRGRAAALARIQALVDLVGPIKAASRALRRTVGPPRVRSHRATLKPPHRVVRTGPRPQWTTDATATRRAASVRRRGSAR